MAPVPARTLADRVMRALFGPEPVARLSLVHVIHTIGNAFFTVSLAGSLFFQVSVDAARPRIVLYLVITMAPFAVVAPLIGPLVDRFRGGYRVVILLVFTAKAVTSALVAVHLRTVFFFFEALLVLVLGKTYAVAKNALVPRLVERREDLVGTNARLARLGTIGGGIGGAGASVLLAATSAGWVVAAAAVFYAMSGLTMLRVPNGRTIRTATSDLALEELQAPAIVVASVAMSILRGAIGFSTFFIAFELKRAGGDPWLYGLVIALSGAGALLGTFVSPVLRHRVSEDRMLALALAVPGLLALVAALRPTSVTIALVGLTLGLGTNVGRHAFDAVVQHRAPDADRGRAFARFEAQFQLMWVVGALIPVLARPQLWLGFVILGAGLAGGTFIMETALATARRAAARQVPLPRTLLEAARAHVSRGTDRAAVVLAATAVEVAASQSGVSPDSLGVPWHRIDRARRTAIDGDLQEEEVELALRLAAESVDRLRQERAQSASSVVTGTSGSTSE